MDFVIKESAIETSLKKSFSRPIAEQGKGRRCILTQKRIGRIEKVSCRKENIPFHLRQCGRIDQLILQFLRRVPENFIGQIFIQCQTGIKFYVRSGNRLRPVAVKTGLNAGGRIEIIEGELSPGDKVVIAATEHRPERQPNAQSRSPFMPTPTRRGPSGVGSAAKRARAEQNSGAK